MFSFVEQIEKKGALVMGILNVTPDSFSDGGEAFSVDSVIEKVNELINDGADIIDVGACSTAPNNQIVSEEEEIFRLKAFLPSVIASSTVPVSVDTFRSRVARCALELGAAIINDESGAFSADMALAVKEYGAGWIFMHTGGGDSRSVVAYDDVTADVLSFFADMKRRAVDFGIADTQLCFDCGIGFGKTRDDDLALLADCGRLSEYSPLLIGVSRKRIIGHMTGIDNPKDRDFASAVASAIAVSDGAGIVRVHNVAVMRQALDIVNKLEKGVL